MYWLFGRALFNQEKSKLMQTKGQLLKNQGCFFVCTTFDSFLNDLLGGYLRKYGINPVDCGIIKDHMDELSDQILAALKDYDIVITTGGVSAGDFDYIPRAAERIGARLLFHGIPLKPGGAMLAAEKEGKVILGLSGNPGAAAVGLLRVGLPYIKKLCGRAETEFAQAEAVF